MKRFLRKIALYCTISFAVIITVILISFVFLQKSDYNYVSNSTGYNLKAGFILKNFEKYNNAELIVIGSSMSMNNINAKMMQDSFKISTINLSSFGMTIDDFSDYNIWSPQKYIYLNIHFPDFSSPVIQRKKGFPFTRNKLYQLYNIALSFKGYLIGLVQAKEYTDPDYKNHYSYCGFDECGSALLSNVNFHYIQKQWDEDMFVSYHVDNYKMLDYVKRIKNILASHPAPRKLIISFSPSRQKFYRPERSIMVKEFERLLKAECPQISFINKYEDQFPDSLYVDYSHFNILGANRYTSEIIQTIKDSALLK